MFCTTIRCISEIDVNVCMAKLAIEDRYCRPTIESRDVPSYLEAKDIRHPLVEKVHTETEYVTNDVTIAGNGMLLYGTNACGKSTLMKSIGLSLVMAQAGWFVPCSRFTYSPYTQIFTRILNNDNMFRGQSSFAVEMGELRNIFTRSNDRSLVLGDELCSGTETHSAICIVAGGLMRLSEKRVSYIFTSHLHQLMDVPEVMAIDTLRINHLKIRYDREKDLLIYDRKLVEGPGPSSYGLEVCKSMDMDPTFMSYASTIHRNLQKQTPCAVNHQQSVYNPNVFMDQCGIRECSHRAEETHHIKEQMNADQDNMIDHHHKNKKHN